MADLALDSEDQSVSVAMVLDTMVDTGPVIMVAVSAVVMAVVLVAAMGMAAVLAVVITAAFEDTRIFIHQSLSSQAN